MKASLFSHRGQMMTDQHEVETDPSDAADEARDAEVSRIFDDCFCSSYDLRCAFEWEGFPIRQETCALLLRAAVAVAHRPDDQSAEFLFINAFLDDVEKMVIRYAEAMADHGL